MSKPPSIRAVHTASLKYADMLNGRSMTGTLEAVVAATPLAGKIAVAPYCYIQERVLDIENAKGKIVAHAYADDVEIDVDDLQDIKEYAAPALRSAIREAVGRKTNICGMLGIPIYDGDGESFGDHYVAYVVYKQKLYYFDSALGGPCSDSTDVSTYVAIRAALSGYKRTECNSATFEEAGGVSEDDESFVAQNIFCHSWCLWFIHTLLSTESKGALSMAKVDAFAPFKPRAIAQAHEGDREILIQARNKANLVLIKKFILGHLIESAGLSKLLTSRLAKEGTRWTDAFGHIIVPASWDEYGVEPLD